MRGRYCNRTPSRLSNVILNNRHDTLRIRVLVANRQYFVHFVEKCIQ